MISIYRYAVVFIFLILPYNIGHSQHRFEDQTEIFAHATDAEKIYLQLSGKTFNTSEAIWYKAIVTNVLNHIPTTKSQVLHVELIDLSDNQIIDSNLLKLTDGMANGFFQLHSNYREGRYRLRAYTEWNRNFGQDFIFSVPVYIFSLKTEYAKADPIKEIVVTKDSDLNTLSLSSSIAIKNLDSIHTGDAMLYMDWKGGKDSILIEQKRKIINYKVQHEIPQDAPIINYRLETDNKTFAKSIVLNEEYSALQFFPEGGALVEGLQSVVGFKYLNYRGKGANIRGHIEDENKIKVLEFKSNALGMGKIVLTPEEGQTYFGVLTTKSGKTLRYKLPKAKKQGQVLNLSYKEPDWLLRIWNKEKNRDSLFIKFFHRGKNLFGLKTRFRKGIFSYVVKPEKLPHGVIGFTVYDKNYMPVAERHFFNQLNNERLDISLETNRDLYFSRDSVQVSISTRHKNKPTSASVSMMAVDADYFKGTNLDRSHIVSYFLLQSDIKGEIENPSYYFDNSKNLIELDYLMLTQGWTNYKYKERPKSKPIKPEKGLEIKGEVNLVEMAISKANTNKKYLLNMLMIEESLEAYIVETDSIGKFKLELNDSYGYGNKFLIQPSEESHNSEKLKIDIIDYKGPEITFESENTFAPVDSIIEKKINQKIEEDLNYESSLFENAITLDEVQLSDYKITLERAEMVKLHGMPDLVIDNQELMNKRKRFTNDLYRWLLFNYPSAIRVERVGNSPGFQLAYVYGAEWTYVVVDGVPVHEMDYKYIENIPVSAVKSVEIIRNTQTANTYFSDVFDCAPICPPPFAPAILAIYTYSGNGLLSALKRQKSTNLIKYNAPQFSPIREFYAPEYHESSNIDWDIPDRRTLLHWEPNLLTNSQGQASTSFFNGDLTGKMLIICEGITSTGKVGYTELFYDVDSP